MDKQRLGDAEGEVFVEVDSDWIAPVRAPYVYVEVEGRRARLFHRLQTRRAEGEAVLRHHARTTWMPLEAATAQARALARQSSLISVPYRVSGTVGAASS